MAVIDPDNSQFDQAVAEGGAYDIIRRRLTEQGEQLKTRTASLNQARLEEFGHSEMAVSARVRVRTENNCIPRDIVQVGDVLLFGYNVFIGLKTETRVADVFALFRLEGSGDDVAMKEIPLAGTFLAEPAFQRDFEELYRYYKHTHLVQLAVRNGKLLAAFQIGERRSDMRVFRWNLSADGKQVTYIDNRGERDIQLPPAFDFEWSKTTRDQVINGKHPHVNILDQIFVETVGGDLTVKIENNTESGLGIYRDPVDDLNQSIDDGEFWYAELGSLILLKILPYRETAWRYLVFNKLTREVQRIDAIGASCVQLPEDHGIVFPGGYYLQTGQYKTFDDGSRDMLFSRMIRSPNGEDVLYVFYEANAGLVGLFAYNMINKTLQNPIYGDGYALAEDGTLVIFAAVPEPTRVHPMQVWRTPFFSAEHASREPPKQTFLGRVGNAELVRGIADLFAIARIIDNQSVTLRLYEELRKATLKIFDDHYWIGDADTASFKPLLLEIAKTAELAVDEFEKVENIRQQSVQALAGAEQQQNQLLAFIRTSNWETTDDHVRALDAIRRQRGHLATIRDHRYIDVARIEQLEQQLLEQQKDISERTVTFLADERALRPYEERIEQFYRDLEIVTTVAELAPLLQQIDTMASGLDLLTELLATLKVGDATVHTRIIDGIAAVYAKLNQCKAQAGHKQKSFGSAEAVAQFGAQFKLLSQSIANAIGLASTPEACDEQMARLLVQLEELESQFADREEFLADIVAKREEIYETFEAHKQQLLDERQRKAQAVVDAASRVLASIERRAQKFTDAQQLNTFFAADAMVLKVREFVAQLRELDNAVKADDVEAKFKSIRDQGARSLRDKSDLFEAGGNVVKLGPRHKFSVNTQELDLTLIPRQDSLYLHLTGTEYYQQVDDPALNELKSFWTVTLESESADIYRAEYLAASRVHAAEQNTDGLNSELLKDALLDSAAMQRLVRDYAAQRYREGYEKGIHDHDAALILQTLLPALEQADLLRFDPLSRGFAQKFWANLESFSTQTKNPINWQTWSERAQSAAHMQRVFGSQQAAEILAREIQSAMAAFVEAHPLPVNALTQARAAEYLVLELGRERLEFIGSRYAQILADELRRSLDDVAWRRYQTALEKLVGMPAARWNLSHAWFSAMVTNRNLEHLRRYIPEAIALLNADQRLDRRMTQTDLEFRIEGLLGEHALIKERSLSLSVDAFLEKVERHRREFIPAYRRFLAARQQFVDGQRRQLRLQDFKARPLTSFVRNRLITESYLPIIGDNLAKQMGTVGENKRSDLMGLLMMISPPGYGKTTLMEYVANRLGLIFMRINCPALGHDVLSLDPAQAPNATARQELNKLNLALEMGNNVMLYLDDIQHTHPEFLQKFISLCDGTRRIEGVWRGETKTYDMRGRKFCVVMAGNPYTESGEVFKIPDMLANRADIYNLGDILGGMEEQFALSYIENCLTSNPVLAPLATRDLQDLYKFVKMAQGENIATTDLSHNYSAAEVSEIVDVLRKLFVVRDIVMKVNRQYIISAAQAEKYRTEPPFKLQGSYRNMNKMAEKIASVMNEQELQQMIADHYLGEAQLLTSGAEENLLKLAEIRGALSAEQKARWEQIKADFLRNKAMGGDDADTGSKIVVQLADLVGGVRDLAETARTPSATESDARVEKRRQEEQQKLLLELVGKIQNSIAANRPNVEVINQPVPGLDKLLETLTASIEQSLYPIVRSMDKKLEIDLRTHYKMQDISKQLADIEVKIQKELADQKKQLREPRKPDPKPS
jgi:uncharacterized membrane protein YuzA (DUF378 family)